jgi:hypothetical protein
MNKPMLGLAVLAATLSLGGVARAQTYPVWSPEGQIHAAVQSALQHDGAASRNCMPPGLPPTGIGALPASNTTCQ